MKASVRTQLGQTSSSKSFNYLNSTSFSSPHSPVYSVQYLFKENFLGGSWPQAIPPMRTPPNYAHINQAWGSLFSPLKACTIAEPWMQAYSGAGLPEPVVFCSLRSTSLTPINSWFIMFFSTNMLSF